MAVDKLVRYFVDLNLPMVDWTFHIIKLSDKDNDCTLVGAAVDKNTGTEYVTCIHIKELQEEFYTKMKEKFGEN